MKFCNVVIGLGIVGTYSYVCNMHAVRWSGARLLSTNLRKSAKIMFSVMKTSFRL